MRTPTGCESAADMLATKHGGTSLSIARRKGKEEGRLALLNLGGGRQQYGGALGTRGLTKLL